jgi:hypothetical protein
LKGASAQSPPVDTFFQKDFLMNSLLGNREYLFDQVPALMAIFDNVNSLDQMAEVLPRMSLVKQGLLGKPMAPMLILGGVLDTQVPISDIYLLLSKGDTPKTAWINPQGGHLGRQVKVWPDPVIFKQVIIPWLVQTLEHEPVHDAHLTSAHRQTARVRNKVRRSRIPPIFPFTASYGYRSRWPWSPLLCWATWIPYTPWP